MFEKMRITNKTNGNMTFAMGSPLIKCAIDAEMKTIPKPA